MPVPILVVTPHTAFGELVRISLEDSKQYQVQLVFSGQEARAYWSNTSYQLAILDADLLDEPFVPLCYDLLDQQKGIRLVIIPPENNPNHTALGGLIPHGYLNRPFYLPDLMETVSRLTRQQGSESSAGKAPLSYTLPPWLQDPLMLQNYLEKEIISTQSLAGFIAFSGPQPGEGELRARTGRLNDAAANELAGIVFRYWNRDEKTDLMRFMRLASNKTDYLVYATQISGDMVLILVYDTSAPLSQIRPQTRAIAQTLSAIPPKAYRTAKLPTITDGSTQAKPETGKPAEAHSGNRAVYEPETQPYDSLRFSERGYNDSLESILETSQEKEKTTSPETPTIPVDKAEAQDDSHETNAENLDDDEVIEDDELIDDDGTIINLTALLGNIPAPDPDRNAPEPPLAAGWDYHLASTWNTASTGESIENWASSGKQVEKGQEPVDLPLWTAPGNDHSTGNTEPANAQANQKKEDTANAGEAAPKPQKQPGRISLPVQTPVQEDQQTGEKAPVAVEEHKYTPDRLEDTQPRVIAAITSIGQLEPISPAISLLKYTCVLVPRMPQHFLVSELADQLSSWVQQLCLAFGWRLEGIAIRPDYLQWTVQVAPSISPGNLVRIIRQRTSQQIFDRFEHLKEQNPSGDFWAIGYLIVSGSQPPSAQLLRDYIVQTRKRQGIVK